MNRWREALALLLSSSLLFASPVFTAGAEIGEVPEADLIDVIEVDPENSSQAEKSTETEKENDSGGETDSKPASESGESTDSKPDDNSEASTDVKPDINSGTSTDSKPENESGESTDSKPDKNSDALTDSRPENESGESTDSKPNNNSDTSTDSNPESNSGESAETENKDSVPAADTEVEPDQTVESGELVESNKEDVNSGTDSDSANDSGSFGLPEAGSGRTDGYAEETEAPMESLELSEIWPYNEVLTGLGSSSSSEMDIIEENVPDVVGVSEADDEYSEEEEEIIEEPEEAQVSDNLAEPTEVLEIGLSENIIEETGMRRWNKERLTGKCGDDLSWALETDSATLSITGIGPMWDVSDNGINWAGHPEEIYWYDDARNGNLEGVKDSKLSLRYYIQSVTLPEGLTSIGTAAFNSGRDSSSTDGRSSGGICTEIIIPATVERIGRYSFANLDRLPKVRFAEGSNLYSISANAFECDYGLTNIVFPETLKSIGDRAFYKAYLTDSITIPSGVSYLGDNAFGACRELSEFRVSEANETYASQDGVIYSKDMRTLVAFPAGSGIVSYSMPDSIASIERDAFGGNNSLTSLQFSPLVKTIPSLGFDTESALSAINIPEGIETIEYGAFLGTKLKAVGIPGSIKSIDNTAFDEAYVYKNQDGNYYKSGDFYLTEVTFPGSGNAWKSVAKSDDNWPYPLAYADIHCSDGVLSIKSDTGEEVTDTIGAASGRIGKDISWILGGSKNKKVLTITGSGEMYDRAIDDAGLINSKTNRYLYTEQHPYPKNDSYGILDNTVSGSDIAWWPRNVEIKEVNFSPGITKIGKNAFFGCQIKAKIGDLPSSLVSISENAFAMRVGYSFTGKLEIPQGVTVIGKNAFKGNRKLTSLKFKGFSLGTIEDGAFYNCRNLSGTLSLPGSVTYIGDWAFAHCKGFKPRLNLWANPITYIGDYAFYNAFGGTVLDTGEEQGSVLTEESEDSESVSEKGKLELPAALEHLGSYSFARTGFKGTVTIPANVKSTAAGEGYETFSPFAYSTEIKKIKVDSENPYFATYDDGLYDKNFTDFYEYPAGKNSTKFKIKETVNQIMPHAMAGCKKSGTLDLTEMLGSRLKRIKAHAFDGTKFTTINIPSSVEAVIGEGFPAFRNSRLTQINYEGTRQKWRELIRNHAYLDAALLSATVYCTGESGRKRIEGMATGYYPNQSLTLGEVTVTWSTGVDYNGLKHTEDNDVYISAVNADGVQIENFDATFKNNKYASVGKEGNDRPYFTIKFTGDDKKYNDKMGGDSEHRFFFSIYQVDLGNAIENYYGNGIEDYSAFNGDDYNYAIAADDLKITYKKKKNKVTKASGLKLQYFVNGKKRFLDLKFAKRDGASNKNGQAKGNLVLLKEESGKDYITVKVNSSDKNFKQGTYTIYKI